MKPLSKNVLKAIEAGNAKNRYEYGEYPGSEVPSIRCWDCSKAAGRNVLVPATPKYVRLHNRLHDQGKTVQPQQPGGTQSPTKCAYCNKNAILTILVLGLQVRVCPDHVYLGVKV